MRNQQAALGELQKLIRDSSLASLRDYSQVTDLSTAEISGSFPVLGQWMSLILISGDFLRIIFKVHFVTRSGRHFANASFKCDPEAIEVRQLLDFTKEYCNQVAGKIKWEIESQGLQLGLSLPMSMRGFDEVYFPVPDQKSLFGDRWRLVSPDASMAVSVLIDITDPEALAKLSFEKTAPLNSGEMELF